MAAMDASPRTVVIGSNGMVGHALMRYLSDAVGTYRNSRDNLIDDRCYEFLDITEKEKVDSFFEKHKPRRVFLAAYNPWVDGCENPDTDKTNVFGVSNIIGNCTAHNSQLIFFSSSYVFEGDSQVPYKPKDETFPVNRYGRQKERIEKCLMEREELHWLIIRTVGVFGHEGTPKNFVHQVYRAARANKRVQVPSDETMNPVWSMDLAKTSIHLSDRYSREVFHVAGNKCLTKYEFAVNVAYKAGHKKPHEVIVGVKSADMNRMANRPKNGCLDVGSLQARAIKIPNFEKGLKNYMREEYGIRFESK
jgi:dTDP-4-dehydrorhamnose reductase